MSTTAPKTEAPKLSATELKLLRQIQAQAVPKPAVMKLVSNSLCGFM